MQPDKMIPRARTIQVAEQEPDNNEAGQTAGNKGDKEPPPKSLVANLEANNSEGASDRYESFLKGRGDAWNPQTETYTLRKPFSSLCSKLTTIVLVE